MCACVCVCVRACVCVCVCVDTACCISVYTLIHPPFSSTCARSQLLYNFAVVTLHCVGCIHFCVSIGDAMENILIGTRIARILVQSVIICLVFVCQIHEQ